MAEKSRKETKKPKITLKQKKLVDEYLKTGNITQSAITAGYSKKTASTTGKRTLDKDYVQDYLQERLKQIDDESIADMKEVRQRLTMHARGQVKEQQAMTVKNPKLMDVPDKFGNMTQRLVYVEETVVAEVTIKASDQIKALELLGKTGAIFTDKTDVTAKIEPVNIIDDIPDVKESKGANDDA